MCAYTYICVHIHTFVYVCLCVCLHDDAPIDIQRQRLYISYNFCSPLVLKTRSFNDFTE